MEKVRGIFVEKINFFMNDKKFEEDVLKKIELYDKNNDDDLVRVFETIVGSELNNAEKSFILGDFKRKLMELDSDWFTE